MDNLTKKRRLKLTNESPEKDVSWLKQIQSTLKEKVKILKDPFNRT